jgi:streptogrisin B
LALLALGLVEGSSVRADGHQSYDPAAHALADDWDVDLDEAQRRIDLQIEVDGASERLADRLGRQFGGVWMDQAAGVGVLGTIGSLDEARQALREEGLEGSVEPRRTARSLAHIESVRDRLWPESLEANEDAEYPVLVGIGVLENKVTVEAPTDDQITERQAAFLDRARDRFGASLAVKRANVRGSAGQCLPVVGCLGTTTTTRPPTSTTTSTTTTTAPPPRCNSSTFPHCDEPLRAGLWTQVSGVETCTVGFIARSGSTYFAFTAGHCWTGSSTHNWSVRMPKTGSFHVVGPMTNRNFSSSGDMAVIRVNNPSGWALPRNWVYVRQSDGDRKTTEDPQYPITATGTSPGLVGSYVCYTGGGGTGAWQGTGTRCGIVETHETPLTYMGVTVQRLARVRVQWCKGMSGGPVYVNRIAYGIAVAFSEPNSSDGRCGSYMYYQGIRGAESGMGVSVVTG